MVDFDFYPHYEEDLLERIKNNYKGNKIYLVKDGEEVIVENGSIKVMGEERVIT